MDELIKTVADKAGISPEQAKSAVDAVVEFAKAKLPAVGEHLQGLLSGGGNPLSGAADALKKRFGF